MEQQEVKNSILEKITKGKPALLPLPDIPDFPYAKNPEDDFIDHLVGFDGRAIKLKTRDDAVKWLLAQPDLDKSQNIIYSTVSEIEGNLAESECTNPQSAAKISSCVTEGLMGVGEMGAIWVTNASLGFAPCVLLARKLYILLDYVRIIGSMHEAYAQIKLGDQQYGSFYTGPSATADIEAVHITGAQGPLALTALIYNSPNAPEKPELIVNPNADTSIWAKEE